MKRYLISITACVTAILCFAFAAPTKLNTTFFVFQFNHTSFTEANVENESLWSYVTQSSSPSMCEDIDEKACRVAVVVDYVDNPTITPTLKNTANIDANVSGSTAHVVSIAGASNFFSNRAN